MHHLHIKRLCNMLQLRTNKLKRQTLSFLHTPNTHAERITRESTGDPPAQGELPADCAGSRRALRDWHRLALP